MFNRLFLGGVDTASRARIWDELRRRGDQRVVGHPMLNMPDWRQRAIALGLHGDGVPVLGVGKSGTKSYETYSCQSMFATGSTNEIKMFAF